MPLGDSITAWGCGVPLATLPEWQNRSTFGGWRNFLGQNISASRLANWTFTGSQFACGQHEGHSGWTAQELLERLPAVLPVFQPDILLVQAGTNDLFNNQPNYTSRGANVTVTAQRLTNILNTSLALLPGLRIVLSGVTQINATRCATYPMAPWHPPACPALMPLWIDELNALLPAVAAQFPGVTFHDVNTEKFTADDFWQWGIHFSEQGFAKIAAAHWRALKPVLEEIAAA